MGEEVQHPWHSSLPPSNIFPSWKIWNLCPINIKFFWNKNCVPEFFSPSQTLETFQQSPTIPPQKMKTILTSCLRLSKYGILFFFPNNLFSSRFQRKYHKGKIVPCEILSWGYYSHVRLNLIQKWEIFHRDKENYYFYYLKLFFLIYFVKITF